MGLSHFVWSNGSVKHVKAAEFMDILVVSPLWVERCKMSCYRVPESDYLVDSDSITSNSMTNQNGEGIQESVSGQAKALREPDSPFFSSTNRLNLSTKESFHKQKNDSIRPLLASTAKIPLPSFKAAKKIAINDDEHESITTMRRSERISEKSPNKVIDGAGTNAFISSDSVIKVVREVGTLGKSDDSQLPPSRSHENTSSDSSPCTISSKRKFMDVSLDQITECTVGKRRRPLVPLHSFQQAAVDCENAKSVAQRECNTTGVPSNARVDSKRGEKTKARQNTKISEVIQNDSPRVRGDSLILSGAAPVEDQLHQDPPPSSTSMQPNRNRNKAVSSSSTSVLSSTSTSSMFSDFAAPDTTTPPVNVLPSANVNKMGNNGAMGNVAVGEQCGVGPGGPSFVIALSGFGSAERATLSQVIAAICHRTGRGRELKDDDPTLPYDLVVTPVGPACR